MMSRSWLKSGVWFHTGEASVLTQHIRWAMVSPSSCLASHTSSELASFPSLASLWECFLVIVSRLHLSWVIKHHQAGSLQPVECCRKQTEWIFPGLPQQAANTREVLERDCCLKCHSEVQSGDERGGFSWTVNHTCARGWHDGGRKMLEGW